MAELQKEIRRFHVVWGVCKLYVSSKSEIGKALFSFVLWFCVRFLFEAVLVIHSLLLAAVDTGTSSTPSLGYYKWWCSYGESLAGLKDNNENEAKPNHTSTKTHQKTKTTTTKKQKRNPNHTKHLFALVQFVRKSQTISKQEWEKGLWQCHGGSAHPAQHWVCPAPGNPGENRAWKACADPSYHPESK